MVVVLPLYSSLLGRYVVAPRSPRRPRCLAFRGECLALVIFVFANVDDTIGRAHLARVTAPRPVRVRLRRRLRIPAS
jgi:hypothetical protein